ncbi:hypothetical protein EW146_g6551 [Bondarzewia mesenterica]|uniref:Uncharacterized protein n=1 Tax=Bondarzewia mesenterica TaxID=1095465 RepID=A0A4S4LQ36_9AGAM|nr:hypothetical protein EW146_g6551 [Bondarzewia mesenterica]
MEDDINTAGLPQNPIQVLILKVNASSQLSPAPGLTNFQTVKTPPNLSAPPFNNKNYNSAPSHDLVTTMCNNLSSEDNRKIAELLLNPIYVPILSVNASGRPSLALALTKTRPIIAIEPKISPLDVISNHPSQMAPYSNKFGIVIVSPKVGTGNQASTRLEDQPPSIYAQPSPYLNHLFSQNDTSFNSIIFPSELPSQLFNGLEYLSDSLFTLPQSMRHLPSGTSPPLQSLLLLPKNAQSVYPLPNQAEASWPQNSQNFNTEYILNALSLKRKQTNTAPSC